MVHRSISSWCGKCCIGVGNFLNLITLDFLFWWYNISHHPAGHHFLSLCDDGQSAVGSMQIVLQTASSYPLAEYWFLNLVVTWLCILFAFIWAVLLIPSRLGQHLVTEDLRMVSPLVLLLSLYHHLPSLVSNSWSWLGHLHPWQLAFELPWLLTSNVFYSQCKFHSFICFSPWDRWAHLTLLWEHYCWHHDWNFPLLCWFTCCIYIVVKLFYCSSIRPEWQPLLRGTPTPVAIPSQTLFFFLAKTVPHLLSLLQMKFVPLMGITSLSSDASLTLKPN